MTGARAAPNSMGAPPPAPEGAEGGWVGDTFGGGWGGRGGPAPGGG